MATSGASTKLDLKIHPDRGFLGARIRCTSLARRPVYFQETHPPAFRKEPTNSPASCGMLIDGLHR